MKKKKPLNYFNLYILIGFLSNFILIRKLEFFNKKLVKKYLYLKKKMFKYNKIFDIYNSKNKTRYYFYYIN